MSLGPGNKSLLRRGGGGKIRFGNFLFRAEAVTKDPSRKFLIPRRGGRWAGGGKNRLAEILILRRGGRWAGGGKNRLGAKDPSRKFLIPRERRSLDWRWKEPSRSERSVLEISYSQERRSPSRSERSAVRIQKNFTPKSDLLFEEMACWASEPAAT